MSKYSKYVGLIDSLATTGHGQMKVFGSSMLPKISSGSTLDYRREKSYKVGDIVFCKVRGRFIDAHLIVAVEGDQYQIANNHGFINGWTRLVYGRVVRAVALHGEVKEF